MSLREAAQQALDALKCLVEAYEMQNMIRADINDAEYAINALRAALEHAVSDERFAALVAEQERNHD
jgi:hypothetical protein